MTQSEEKRTFGKAIPSWETLVACVDEERRLRKFNRSVWGPFLWRYHLDTLLGWVIGILPRNEK